jgi:hypothetical protein
MAILYIWPIGHIMNMAIIPYGIWPFWHNEHRHYVCLLNQQTKTNTFSGERTHIKHLGRKYGRLKKFGQNMANYPL